MPYKRNTEGNGLAVFPKILKTIKIYFCFIVLLEKVINFAAKTTLLEKIRYKPKNNYKLQQWDFLISFLVILP